MVFLCYDHIVIEPLALFHHSVFASSSWGLERAAVCDCGTPWTFPLLFFDYMSFTVNSRGPYADSTYTINSRYLEFQGTPSLKHFEISVPRHIRFAELRKTINRTTTFNKRSM